MCKKGWMYFIRLTTITAISVICWVLLLHEYLFKCTEQIHHHQQYNMIQTFLYL